MNDRRETKITVNRALVGVCALLCVSAAVVLAVLHFQSEADDTTYSAPLGAFVRVGLIMSALWLAMPPKRDVEVSPKVLVLSLAALIGVAMRPRVAVPLILIVAVLAVVLRPRNKQPRK